MKRAAASLTQKINILPFVPQVDIPVFLSKSVEDLEQMVKRGPPFTLADLPAYIDALRNFKSGINDREFLKCGLQRLAVKLNVKIQLETIQDNDIDFLAACLDNESDQHPLSSPFFTIPSPSHPAVYLQSTRSRHRRWPPALSLETRTNIKMIFSHGSSVLRITLDGQAIAIPKQTDLLSWDSFSKIAPGIICSIFRADPIRRPPITTHSNGICVGEETSTSTDISIPTSMVVEMSVCRPVIEPTLKGNGSM
ncbi:hypothetical protein DFH29DRAFT_1083206 [Suillus ampliporus]|nr:hypothetical protein DFH29DRAFT_1083206 [Suillus ampliporus]